MSRQQLPPQIRKIDVAGNGKTVVRYELRVDGAVSAATGKRQQVKRRFDTERAARIALAEVTNDANTGMFVARSGATVAQVCADFLAGRYNLRPTSGSKLAYDLSPLIERYGSMPVQALTKAHLDALIGALVKGGTVTGKGRVRRPWSAVSINKAIDAWAMVLDDAHRQGLTVRNVAGYVSHVAVRHHDVDTYTSAEVQTILASIGDDRIRHAWELALSGLRRGEVAGLRWSDVDLDAKTLAVTNNRVDAGGTVTETDPKTELAPDSAVAGSAGVGAAVGQSTPGPRTTGARLRPLGLRGVQRGWRTILTASAVPWLAQGCQAGRGARDQTARCPAHLRHADAPVRRAHGGDRGVDRAQRPHLDHAAVRAQPGRRAGRRW